MTNPVVYGIKNCDTIKKARKWLTDNNVDYHFHDYRADGVDESLLQKWCVVVGWETLLNQRGTTWRKLPEAQREGIDMAKAIALMIEHPAIIKRPVLTADGKTLVGFKADEYAQLLQK